MISKYITLDEFELYFNLSLREQLGSEEKALAFLKRIEDRLEAYLNSNFNRNINMEYPQFTDYQKEHYKLALLEQAIYIFKNGDVSVDSGYDLDKGQITTRDNIIELSVAPNAIDQLRLCGLWNRNLHKNRGIFRLWP